VSGLCRDCLHAALPSIVNSDHKQEPDPDDYVQIAERDPPDEPEGQDLLTENFVYFYSKDSTHQGPVVVVAAGADWRREVKRFMLRERWFPNVWHVSGLGTFHLLSLNEEN
jgi:hypothetical protein